MRWLVIGLLVSVGALLFVAGAVARYVRRQRRSAEDSTNRDAQKAQHRELDQALDFPELDLPESVDSKGP